MVFIDAIGKHEPHPVEVHDHLAQCDAARSRPSPRWHVQEEVRTAEDRADRVRLPRSDDRRSRATKERQEDRPRCSARWSGSSTGAGRAEQRQARRSRRGHDADQAAREVRMEELHSGYASAHRAHQRPRLRHRHDVRARGRAERQDDNGTYLMVSAIYRIEFGDHESIDDLKPPRAHEGFLLRVHVRQARRRRTTARRASRRGR